MATFMRVLTTFSGVQGAPYYNNLCFQAVGGTYDVAAANAAITAAKNFWFQFTVVWVATTSFVVNASVDVLDSTSGDITGRLTGTSQTGAGVASGSDPLPFASQGLVAWSTGQFLRGRQIVGRTFIPALLESASVGTSSTQLQSSAASAITALITTPTAVKFSVYSRAIKAKPAAVPPIAHRDGAITNVNGGTLRAQFAVLRSRRN